MDASTATRLVDTIGWQLAVGAAAYASSFLVYIFSLRHFRLSLVYPVYAGLGYVLVVAASVVVLNEHITRTQAIGIALVLAGVLLVQGRPA